MTLFSRQASPACGRVSAWAGALLLLAALAGGLLWQAQGRASQRVDVGGPLDAVAAIDFHERERGDLPASQAYRWSRPESRLRLSALPAGTPAVLSLRLFAPAQPDGPQHVRLTLGGQPLGRLAVEPRPRVFHFVVHTPQAAPLELALSSPQLRVDGDPRALGVAVGELSLTALELPTPAGLLAELFAAPLLPLALLLLAGMALLLRLAPIWAGGLPALALLLLVAADRWLRDARLMLAWYLLVAAALALAALSLAALLRRWPALLPADDRRARIWIAAAFALMLALAFTPQVRVDGIEYYAYLRSAAVDGDLNFANEYRETPFQGVSPKFQRTVTGNYENLAAIGPAVAWAPLYGVAHLLVLAGRALGLPWQADGYAPPYVILTVFTSALAGLAIMLAGYRIARRWAEPPEATLAAITLLLGSNLLYYTMREGSFAHALSGLAATLYVLAWLRLEERPSVGRWAVLGLAAGATALMYWIAALVLLLPALTFARLGLAALRAPAGERGRRLRELLLGGAAAAALLLLAFSPQLIAWKIIYGSFLAIPHGGDYIRPRELQAGKLLFSHLYGLLPWTPAFFAGLCGLALLWRRSRWLTFCLALAFAAYFGYNASLARWFAGGSFGLRRMTVLTPWFVIGLALLLGALRRWRAIAPAGLAVLMGAWTTLLLVRYDMFVFPHIPEQIAAMPAPAFYITRDTLPLAALPAWVTGGFFPKQLANLANPADVAVFGALLAVMVGASALVLWLDRRLGMA